MIAKAVQQIPTVTPRRPKAPGDGRPAQPDTRPVLKPPVRIAAWGVHFYGRCEPARALAVHT
jgi:hypothetical protein